jgi:hypothetical protein
MESSSNRRLAAPVLIVAASLALAVPALGATRPDDRPGLRGPGGTALTESLRPDDRPGIRGVGVVAATVLRPDDRPGVRGIEAAAVAAPTSVLVTAEGFDWSAAGAGAGGATGLIALLGAAALTVRRSHRRAGTAT